MPEQFQFLQPLWLLNLFPLAFLIWRLRRTAAGDNAWARIIDIRLRPLLLVGQDNKVSRLLIWSLALGWLLATVALANPVWEKQPQPLYQTSAARVIVLDLSLSMLDKDLKPSRLARARFKIEDVLARNDEGQTGLVVFAGDAFTVTPLTRDADTIRALLKSLDPGLMPVQGSRADLGLIKAGELLQQAGLRNGQIILFADGVTGNKARQAAKQLRKKGYRVSVLGIGSQNAEPLTNAKGQLLRTTDRKLIEPQLETAALQAVAKAGGGRYRTFNNGDSDIKSLLNNSVSLNTENNLISGEVQGQDWKDSGPWLALLLLPLAALAFRRGWLLSMVLLLGVLSPPQPAMASDWEDLWQRPDQQAAIAMEKKDYALASEVAKDPLQRGSAEYKRRNYAQALKDFSHANGTTADYNRGNTLAKLGRYKDAISAYDAALKTAPKMADALANKAAVEALLRQQKKQNKKNQQGKNQQGKNQQGKNQQGKNQQGKNQQGKNQQGKNQQGKNQQGKNQQGKNQQGKNQQGKNQQGKNQQGKNQQGKNDKNQFANAAKALGKKHAEEEKQTTGKSAAKEKEAGQDKNKGLSNNLGKSPAEQKQTQAKGQPAQAEPLSTEEDLAAEQWLRRIPDDPGGLLRRKFLYQYQQRAQRKGTGSRQPW